VTAATVDDRELVAPGEVRPLMEREFDAFQSLVYRAAGIFLSTAKMALLITRLSPRLRELWMTSFGEYFRRCRDSVEERQSRREWLARRHSERLSPQRDMIRVLVVDDSAVVREGFRQLLAGHAEVITARDPIVALERMKQGRPHVIVLDLEMPRKMRARVSCSECRVRRLPVARQAWFFRCPRSHRS